MTFIAERGLSRSRRTAACLCRCGLGRARAGGGPVGAADPDRSTSPPNTSQPHLGGPGPFLPALGPGPAQLLGHTVLESGPGARPGTAARWLPCRFFGHFPATTTPGRPLQFPSAPGLQCLCTVLALPAEAPSLSLGSTPDSCASGTVTPVAGARAHSRKSRLLGLGRSVSSI